MRLLRRCDRFEILEWPLTAAKPPPIDFPLRTSPYELIRQLNFYQRPISGQNQLVFQFVTFHRTVTAL